MTQERRLGSNGTHRTTILALGVLGTLAGIAGIVWWHLRPPVISTVRLSNGALFSLCSVSYGTEHRYDPAPPLLRFLASRGMPIKLPDAQSFQARAPMTVAWVGYRPQSRGRPLRPDEPTADYTRLVDSHGCRFAGDSLLDRMVALRPDTWFWVEVPAEPRGGGEWRLQGVDKDAPETPVYEFRFLSPAPSNPKAARPQRTPNPIPQTVTGKRVTATLKALRQLGGARRASSAAEIVGRERRSPSVRWTPLIAAGYDSFGNLPPADAAHHSVLAERGNTLVFDSPCRKEPFWIVSAWLAPESLAEIGPDHRWGPYVVNVATDPTRGGETISRTLGDSILGMSAEVTAAVIAKTSAKGLLSTKREPLVDVAPFWIAGGDFERLFVRRVNGEPLTALCHRLGIPLTGPMGKIGVAELGESGFGSSLLVPWDGRAKTLTLELDGYRAERIDFVVDPR